MILIIIFFSGGGGGGAGGDSLVSKTNQDGINSPAEQQSFQSQVGLGLHWQTNEFAQKHATYSRFELTLL